MDRDVHENVLRVRADLSGYKQLMLGVGLRAIYACGGGAIHGPARAGVRSGSDEPASGWGSEDPI
jgi:hypothetical protein